MRQGGRNREEALFRAALFLSAFSLCIWRNRLAIDDILGIAESVPEEEIRDQVVVLLPLG
jgi:hypothetical protein